jgi:MFS family permease
MVSSPVANASLGSLASPPMVARYQGLYGVAYTIGTGAGPLIGGALYAIGPWALWTLVGAAGLLSAQLCLPRRRPESTVESAGPAGSGLTEIDRLE